MAPVGTILIQHGFGRTAENFCHWVPALARSYNVIRRELRGYGGSSFSNPDQGGSCDYSTATIVDETKDTPDQLGIGKVHFVGESTSGMLVEIFAATYPGRVLSVIIYSSSTHIPLAGQQFLAFVMSSWPEACRRLGSRGCTTVRLPSTTECRPVLTDTGHGVKVAFCDVNEELGKMLEQDLARSMHPPRHSTLRSVIRPGLTFCYFRLRLICQM